MGNESDRSLGFDSRGGNLAKNTIIFFIGSFSSKLLVFLLLPLYTNYLDPADYGTVDVYVNLLGIAYSVFSLQAIEVVFRFLQDDGDDAYKTLVVSNSFVLCLAGFSLFVFGMIAFWLATGFEYSFLFVLYVGSSILAQYYLQAVRGMKRNTLYAIAGVASTFIQLALNIVLIAVFREGAVSILYASVVAYFMTVVVLCTKIRLWRFFSLRAVRKSELIEQLKFSLPLMPNAVCLWALASLGRYIILLGFGAYEVGIFSYASKFSQILGLVNSVFFMAWQQTALSLQGQSDKNEFASSVLSHYVTVQFTALLVILPLVKVLTFTVMGSAYQEAWVYIPVFFVGILFSAYANFYSMGFFMAKKTATIFVASLIGLFSYALFGIVLSRAEPIFGVGAGFAVSQMMYFLVMKIRVKEHLNPRIDVRKVALPVLLLTLFTVFYYLLSWEMQILIMMVGIVVFTIINMELIRNFAGMLLAKLGA